MVLGSWNNQEPRISFWDEWTSTSNTGLSSDLMGAWQRLQAQAGAQSLNNSLSEIFVISGPGSFTGIRVGAAFAAGLSAGLGINAYSISSFDLFREPVGIPVRTHLAMTTAADKCAEANIEFLFQNPTGVDCRLPQTGDVLLGVEDAVADYKHWPTQAQIKNALAKGGLKKEPLRPDYGIGPKISGVRID